MMGDLPATSYVHGGIFFPSLVPVIIPPVTITIPQRIIFGSDRQDHRRYPRAHASR